MRNIENIFNPPPYHWVGNGFRVHNIFPGRGTTIGKYRMSPFFLMDYESEFYFPPSEIPRGVPSHPHRGLETVTIVYDGKIAHHDSVGNGGVIGNHDVQWMTAGEGILHKEYLENEYNKNGGNCHLVQLWVNLPKQYKMTKPKYQDLYYAESNKFLSDNSEIVVNVIAGCFKGVTGKAEVYSPVELFDMHLKNSAKIDFEFDNKHNLGMLIVEGEVKINNRTTVNKDKFILFENDGKLLQIEANSDSKILILGGEPIKEEIAAYGPFVMNTMDEIHQAYKDYEDGKFGFLD